MAYRILFALVIFTQSLAAQTGDAYRIFDNSIRIDRSAHWNNWTYQNDLVAELNVSIAQTDILHTDSQGLRPRYFRRNINVAPSSTSFTYTDLVRASGELVTGGATAKSNDAVANNILDGNFSTYWEPDTPPTYAARRTTPGDFHIDGVPNWEIEVDLGRLVFADSLTIIFPAGQFGDDFLGEPVK